MAFLKEGFVDELMKMKTGVVLQARARNVGGGGGRGPGARVLLRHLRARQALATDAHAAPPRPPHARSVSKQGSSCEYSTPEQLFSL